MSVDKKSFTNLLQYLQDSRNGYSECAEDVKDSDLKALFSSLVIKRQAMIDEIKAKFLAFETNLPADGSLTGKAHQYFIKLKSLVTGGDRDSIVAEIERGETTAIDYYLELLKENLAEPERLILTKQCEAIRNDLANVKSEAVSV